MNNKYEHWSTEDLKTEIELMSEVLKARREKTEVCQSKNRCINNITTKDFVVYWGSYGMRDRNDKPEYHFSFCIRHDGKSYDIYYEHHDTVFNGGNGEFHPWWPLVGKEGDEDWDRNGAFEFIPPGFAEASENSYEYHGTVEQAVEQLKKYGFVNFQRSKFDDDIDTLLVPKGLE